MQSISNKKVYDIYLLWSYSCLLEKYSIDRKKRTEFSLTIIRNISAF